MRDGIGGQDFAVSHWSLAARCDQLGRDTLMPAPIVQIPDAHYETPTTPYLQPGCPHADNPEITSCPDCG